MANRQRIHLAYIVFFYIVTVLSANLCAQTRESFTQKIEWINDEYAVRYQIEIESVPSGSGKPEQILTKETEKTSITVSLPAGEYRYRIMKYDLLGHPSTPSRWFPLTIVKAIQPEITGITPRDTVLCKGSPLILKVTGRGLSADSTITVNHENGRDKYPVQITGTGKDGILEITAADRTIKEGTYTVTIQNPGNLSCTGGSFTVRFAVQPVISDFSPSEFILQKSENAIIDITGKNIEENASYELISAADSKVTVEGVPGQTEKVPDSKSKVTVTFPVPRPGTYTISVQNTGGLSHEAGPVTVIRTEQPSVIRATSGNYTFKGTDSFSVLYEGTGFQESSIFFLTPQHKTHKGTISSTDSGSIICRESHIRSDGLVEAIFKASDFSNTIYTAAVENPGHLASSGGWQDITVIPASDITFSGGIFIIKDLYNDTLISHSNDSFLKGIQAKAEIIPFKTEYGYFGADLSATYTKWSETKTSYELNMDMALIHMDFVYEHPFFTEKIRVSVHAGPGITVIGKNISYTSSILKAEQDKTYSAFISAQAGIFCTVYPLKHVFLEAGCDFVHIFASDMPTGLIIPGILAGIRL